MKLYRIKRLRDGRFFVGRSHWPFWKWDLRGEFGKTGGFFGNKAIIKKHLYQLCCIYKHGVDARHYEPEKVSGPHWEHLALYEVEILLVVDSETIKQPAKDFMGILEDA